VDAGGFGACTDWKANQNVAFRDQDHDETAADIGGFLLLAQSF
jgi:hypothetical protein